MYRYILVAMLFLLAPALTDAESLTKDQAIALAERFVLENGYTNAPNSKIKRDLDFESIEWAGSREQLLQLRFNTLMPKAIGIKRINLRFPDGWSVAFDYTDPTSSHSCRVVTMKSDGTEMRVEHQDGIRSHFMGFDLK